MEEQKRKEHNKRGKCEFQEFFFSSQNKENKHKYEYTKKRTTKQIKMVTLASFCSILLSIISFIFLYNFESFSTKQ